MSYQSGKETSPEQTIQNIRSILSSIGLFPHECFWASHAKNCYNVRLELDGFEETGVNGKGVNRAYALASAYGELMERLQCGILIKPKFGLMHDVSIKYPDSKNEEAEDIIKRLDEFLSKMYNIDKTELQKVFKDVNISCAPFYHVNSKSEVYLPKNLMLTVTDSNGMCAGNTVSEALVQGLSEVIERYVSKKAASERYAFPEIPKEDVSNRMLKEMIEDVENKGYKLIIKDLTLGGIYPCLGVIFMNSSTMDYFISIGVHPVFDIALQRCITEAFQVHKVEYKMHPLIGLFSDKNDDYVKQYVLGAHKGSLDLLECTESSKVYMDAFVKNYSSNNEMLKGICDKLMMQNFDIYIKDMSYLGFPSYYIYVNGMSEVNEFTIEQLKNTNNNNTSLSDYLLNLDNCNTEELYAVASKMEALDKQFISMGYTAEPKLRIKNIFSILSVIFKPDTDMYHLLQDNDYFLAVLYNRLADYEKAYIHLEKYIGRKYNEISDKKYFLCVLHFFKLKMQDNSDMQKIRATLESIYGPIANDVFEDVAAPEKAFQYHDLPRCGDCSGCSYSDGRCLYQSWKNYMKKYQNIINANPIGQEKLHSLFNGLYDF